ncbi:MAG TPA: alpha/beta hydrolase [Chryseolinea sp.]
MPSHFFHYKNSVLHYTTIGNGPQNLFMFHGFGQDNKSYDALSNVLSQNYTAYIFDLYFHGQSRWGHGELPLEKSHWKETIQEFLRKADISNFSLAGFSLGGKFALATLEAFPEKTKGIILLAPDGIKTSSWYNLATYPIIFRKIFRSMIDHPNRFHYVVRMMHNWGLVDKGLLKFAEFQMNTEEKRARVYFSWVVFRRLHTDLSKVASLINKYRIPLTVIVGQYDKVIQPNDMQPLLKKVDNYVFETPEVGHTGLIAESGVYFSNLNTLLQR